MREAWGFLNVAWVISRDPAEHAREWRSGGGFRTSPDAKKTGIDFAGSSGIPPAMSYKRKRARNEGGLHLVILAAACLCLFLRTAGANPMAVPINLQAEIIKRLFNYDKAMANEARPVVFVVHQDEGPVKPADVVKAFDVANMGKLLWSSGLIVLGVVPVSVTIATMAGYGLVQVGFRGATIIFLFFIIGLTLPFEAVITPLYYEIRALGLLNTRWAIILPLIGLYMPFSVFWMRAHFVNVPAEISEAAGIDGAYIIVEEYNYTTTHAYSRRRILASNPDNYLALM